MVFGGFFFEWLAFHHDLHQDSGGGRGQKGF